LRVILTPRESRISMSGTKFGRASLLEGGGRIWKVGGGGGDTFQGGACCCWSCWIGRKADIGGEVDQGQKCGPEQLSTLQVIKSCNDGVKSDNDRILCSCYNGVYLEQEIDLL
jgi:hypothetical protein